VTDGGRRAVRGKAAQRESSRCDFGRSGGNVDLRPGIADQDRERAGQLTRAGRHHEEAAAIARSGTNSAPRNVRTDRCRIDPADDERSPPGEVDRGPARHLETEMGQRTRRCRTSSTEPCLATPSRTDGQHGRTFGGSKGCLREGSREHDRSRESRRHATRVQEEPPSSVVHVDSPAARPAGWGKAGLHVAVGCISRQGGSGRGLAGAATSGHEVKSETDS